MTGRVAVSRISSSRSVSRAWKPMLVVVFFVSSAFFFAGPTSAVYIVEEFSNSEYQSTGVGGINDLDQIACTVQRDSGDWDAAVYDSVTRIWTLLPDFGTDPDSPDSGQGINNDGEVVGWCSPPIGQNRGAYWPASHDTIIVLETLPGHTDSYAMAVNDLHKAVGVSRGPPEGEMAVLWNLDPDAPSITPQPLGFAEGKSFTWANDINNNNAIVGKARNPTEPGSQAFYCAGLGNPIELLPHLSEGSSYPDSEAMAISDSGLIVGFSRDTSAVQHAVAWQPPYSAAPIDLGAFVGVPSKAIDVSTDQKIVGSQDEKGCGFVIDFVSGTSEYLEAKAAIPGANYCLALAINDGGGIVGRADTVVSEGHAVLWKPDAPPVAAFTMAIAGLTVTVDASASSDSESKIASYEWDFGDGTTGVRETTSHTYADVGIYTITLTVTDSVGQTDSISSLVSNLVSPEAEAAELIEMIDDCTSFDDDVKDRLESKVSIALKLIEARKSHGDPAANILLAFDNLVSDYVLTGEITDQYEAWDLIAQANFVISLTTESHLVDGVPVYTWYHGCGPTAAGMVIGYWDMHGFGELVKGPQSSVTFQSDEVNAMIASQGHIDDYVYPLDGWVNGEWVEVQPDESEGEDAHESDSVADFMHTSWSSEGLVYGQSLVDMVDDAFVEYTDWASEGGYVGAASLLHQSSMSWEVLQSEVDAARPLVFVVDMDGDGDTDHSVTVVGYCEAGRAQLYAFHSTWDNNVWWALFDIMQPGNFYGVYAGVTFSISLVP